MKKWIIIGLILGSLALAACSSQTAATPAPASNSSTSAAPAAAASGENLTQTNDEAMVTVAVTPLNLDDTSAPVLTFKIVLDTHSVDLNYDLAQLATLSSSAGEKVEPTTWTGAPGGGHHKEGVLAFPALKNRGQTLTLTLRGIADVPERAFTWKVN